MKKLTLLAGLLACILIFLRKPLLAGESELETWCKAHGQEWNVNYRNCFVGYRARVSITGSLSIIEGESLTFCGKIDNYGLITNNGSINGYGVDDFICWGTINNYDTIVNNAYFRNYMPSANVGTIYNSDGGTINNYGWHYLEGISNDKHGSNKASISGNIKNYDPIQPNGGQITNWGTLNNAGSFNNYDAMIDNYGKWVMGGTTINSINPNFNSGIIRNFPGGEIYLYGIFEDGGKFTNDGRIYVLEKYIQFPLLLFKEGKHV